MSICEREVSDGKELFPLAALPLSVSNRAQNRQLRRESAFQTTEMKTAHHIERNFQSKNSNLHKAREKTTNRAAVGFSVASDWSRGRCEFSGRITEP